MTCVVGASGGTCAILVADVRASWKAIRADGWKKRLDRVQKIHQVGPHFLAAFAGGVELGYDLIPKLHAEIERTLRHQPNVTLTELAKHVDFPRKIDDAINAAKLRARRRRMTSTATLQVLLAGPDSPLIDGRARLYNVARFPTAPEDLRDGVPGGSLYEPSFALNPELRSSTHLSEIWRRNRVLAIGNHRREDLMPSLGYAAQFRTGTISQRLDYASWVVNVHAKMAMQHEISDYVVAAAVSDDGVQIRGPYTMADEDPNGPPVLCATRAEFVAAARALDEDPADAMC